MRAWSLTRPLRLGHELHTLDVGGGFCQDTFEKFAGILSEAVGRLTSRRTSASLPSLAATM